MDRRRRQRGYTKLTTTILVTLLAVIVYLGFAFWPPARTYYLIKNDARRLANRVLQPNSKVDQLAAGFLQQLRDRDGLELHADDIEFDTSEEGVIWVTVPVSIPYAFPLVGVERTWETEVEVFAERMRGF